MSCITTTKLVELLLESFMQLSTWKCIFIQRLVKQWKWTWQTNKILWCLELQKSKFGVATRLLSARVIRIINGFRVVVAFFNKCLYDYYSLLYKLHKARLQILEAMTFFISILFFQQIISISKIILQSFYAALTSYQKCDARRILTLKSPSKSCRKLLY